MIDFDDFDLITGSIFPVFFAYYKTDSTYTLKLTLVFLGALTGLLIYSVTPTMDKSTDKSIHFVLAMLFRMYILESVLFYKIYLLDIDVAIPLCITPFLLLVCFLLPDPRVNTKLCISDKTYREYAKYSIGILCFVFIIILCVISWDKFRDVIDPMPTFFIFFNCLWFTLEHGYISILYLLFLVFIDVAYPLLTKVIWQSSSPYFIIVQGVILIYTCMIYSIRLKEIFPDYYYKSKRALIIHSLVLNIAIFYMQHIAIASGYICIGLLCFKVYAIYYIMQQQENQKSQD